MHHTIPSPPHCRSAHWHQHIEPQTQTTTFLSLICPNFLSAHRPEWREWRNYRDQIYGWQLMVFLKLWCKKSKSKCFYSQHVVGGKTVGSQGVPCPPRRRWSLAGLRSCGATNHEVKILTAIQKSPEVSDSAATVKICKVYDPSARRVRGHIDADPEEFALKVTHETRLAQPSEFSIFVWEELEKEGERNI